MENVVGFAIESLVAVLLVATIAYCALLNRRLGKLRADEGVMRETITELVASTHAAERAIVALRAALGHCEDTLAERLGRAETMSTAIAGQLSAGEEVIERITRIAKAARDHAAREASMDEIARRDADREAIRLAARRRAEEEEEARALIRRVAEEAEPVSRSAATAAAAELFASRIRALSAGSPA
ncbi:DUF6468 domain-containing protein [Methylopila sp. Yamaguchi]|uniref:DUF6468 domain-containing protein n=1 Tax=Methylopila sp. Yamaguchi TaxID=1437817 RepID=UPI000CC810FE|nr:DUF6468 domain-containing protein [Methylopila sp. Yamaguchi]GBD46878.1 hypothetical protein METY_0091 [Methylopila sp. Yamaguchi]